MGFFDNLFMPGNNPAAVAQCLTDLLKVNIPRIVLTREIRQHPDYPGIHCVSDVLRRFGLTNVVASFQAQKLVNVPTPFITGISEGESSYFTVVREISLDTVKYLDGETQRWKVVPAVQFYSNYQGFVLLAEADAQLSENKNWEKERRRARKLHAMLLLPALLLAAGLVAWWNSGGNFYALGYYMLAVAGTVVCGLLLLMDINAANPMLKRICGIGEKNGCNKILQSAAASITGVKWSEAGAVYFSGSWLYMTIAGFESRAGMLLLTILSIGTVPVMVFSIVYQWRIAKAWCRLCLLTAGILLLQLFLVCIAGWQVGNVAEVRLKDGLQLVAIFALPLMLIAICLPLLKSLLAAIQRNASLVRFSRNPEVFSTLLSAQRRITDDPADFSLTIGPAEARHMIIKVCNPFCEPCAATHPVLKELAAGADVQIKYVFAVPAHTGDQGTQVVQYLMAIAATSSPAVMEKALNEWYLSPVKDLKLFAAKYPVDVSVASLDKIKRMETWCGNNNILFTPTFFVNGYLFPEQYSIQDMQYFLS